MYCFTPKALYNHMGGSLLNHHQCAASTWMMWRLPQDNGASALTTHQLQVERRESHRDNQVYALTTHQLQVERRERHRANQVYALITHQLQVERRESHRDNQVYALTTHQLQVFDMLKTSIWYIVCSVMCSNHNVNIIYFTYICKCVKTTYIYNKKYVYMGLIYMLIYENFIDTIQRTTLLLFTQQDFI